MINIDFETFSKVDLRVHGLYNYVNCPSFEILCYSYSSNHGEVKLWTPEMGEHPSELVEALTDPTQGIHAYNAYFEFRVLLRTYKQFGLDKPLPLKRFYCTQALALYYGAPAGLGRVGDALRLDIQKDKRGTYLINKLCKPKKVSKATPFDRWTPERAPQDFQDLYEYCKRDVEAEIAIVKTLPTNKLPEFEQKVWLHTGMQNHRGLPIDMPLVHAIRDIYDTWKTEETVRLSELTNYEVVSGNQNIVLLRYVNNCLVGKGISTLLDLTKGAIVQYFERHSSHRDPHVDRVLRLRQLLSKTSVAKYKKAVELICGDQTIKEGLFYYAGHTGRYGGRGFQMQNVSRETFKKDTQKAISAAMSGYEEYKQAFPKLPFVSAAAKLVRSCIRAIPGNRLFVSDFKSIEYRVEHWLVGNEEALELLKRGKCPYRSFYSKMAGVPYDEVTDEQRTHGKACVLGLGYQMGAVTHVKTSKIIYNLILPLDSAKRDVNFYRKSNPLITQFWNSVFTAVLNTIKGAGTTCYKSKYATISFLFKNGNLYVKLPSTRILTYRDAGIEMKVPSWGGKEIEQLYYWGVDSTTKRWCKIYTYGGKLVENITQAVARDLLVTAAMNVEKAGFPVIGSVHDEVIAMDKENKKLEDFERAMSIVPAWSKGLPIELESYKEERYKK